MPQKAANSQVTGQSKVQRTPTKSTTRGRTAVNAHAGSSSKQRPRRSLRTPQQHVPLKVEDRAKNRRASKSFVLSDDMDFDTPKTNIQAFMNMTDTVQRVNPSAQRSMTLRDKTPPAFTLDDGVFKAPRLRELAAESSHRPPRVSSPGSKYTPRTNIFNLLAMGEERSMIERTVNLSEPTSPGLQPLTSVENSGQRVSVSPIHDPSTGTDSKHSQLYSRASAKAARRSFHLNVAQQPGVMAPGSPLPSTSDRHSGQRVSVSPMSVSENGLEGNVSHTHNKAARKASRRSFHFNIPQDDDGEQEEEEEEDVEGEKGPKKPSKESGSLSEEFVDEPDGADGSSPPNQISKNVSKNNDSSKSSSPEVGRRASLATKSGIETELIQHSVGPATKEITEHDASYTRKSSVSKLMVSIGKEPSLSEVLPPDYGELGEVEVPEDGGEEGEKDRGTNVRRDEDGGIIEDVDARESDGEFVDEEGGDDDEENEKEISYQGEMDKSRMSQSRARESTMREDERNGEEEKELDEEKTERNARKAAAQTENVADVGASDKGEIGRTESDVQESAPAVVDPASVYNLSEGSSSSRLETSQSRPNKSKTGRGSSAKKRPGSQGKRTPVTGSGRKRGSVTPASARPQSSKRKRLSFSEWKSAQQSGGREAFASPLPGRVLRDSPRSSTPVDRTRRFFNSTKIQRSVTEYFQGDEELASGAVTPTVKNLFSDISPIRAPGTSRKLQARQSESGGVDGGEEVGPVEDNRDEIMQQSQRASRVSNIQDNGSAQDSGSELPSFSSMATPHIDLRKRLPMSSVRRDEHSALKNSKSKAGPSKPTVQKPTQEKRALAKRPRKVPTMTLPRRSVKYFAELHSEMKLSKDAIDEIEEVSEKFWADTFMALEAYALHAGRKTIQDQDVILLMKTQRLITGTEDLHDKIRQMLPMELRTELIPCAYPMAQK